MFYIAVLICIVFADLLPAWKKINLPFHSTIETLGGISALLIAMVLFQQDRTDDNGIFFPVATGFACMGVLDTFHAMCMPGDAFIFLHSAASLAGGFFFSCILLPDRLLKDYVREQRWIAGISIIISLSVGLRAVIFPQNVPKIIHFYEGKFTFAANLINTCAGLLFLVSVPKMFLRYRASKNTDLIVFMYLALLFGIAELIFQYSDTWDGIWWAWHLLRFIAYIMTLLFVVNRHAQLTRKAYGGQKQVSRNDHNDLIVSKPPCEQSRED